MVDFTKTTFMSAMMDYFGKKPGQSAMEFMQEVKALNDGDRKYFFDLLRAVGYPLT
jgi:hypothetical protein